MKTIYLKICLNLLLLIFSFSVFAEETYQVDNNNSYVMWHINHFGFSNQSGKWMVAKGTLILDKQKPQQSKVSVEIHVGDIITGIPELDKHLKSKLFFDVAKFPIATFVSNKITLTGRDTAKAQGMLTVRGVAKPVILDVKLHKMGVNPINNKESVGFAAHTILKRSDFGITTLLPGLGDEVIIDIEIEAYKNA